MQHDDEKEDVLQPRFRTTSEAAHILGTKPRTVTRYIERGLIAAQKPGRDYLIEEDELKRFQSARRKPGNPGTKRGEKKTPAESPN